MVVVQLLAGNNVELFQCKIVTYRGRILSDKLVEIVYKIFK